MLTELRGPFFFGVAMFSMLTIATVVLQEAARFVIRYPVPPSMFFTLVGLAAPQFIVLSIPMGVLLGTLMAVGRLNSDQEITALRACGISLYRVLLPFLVVGLFLSGLMFLGNERIVPACLSRLREIKNDVQTGRTKLGSQQRMVWPIYFAGELRWLLTAGKIEGYDLQQVKLFYFDPTSKDNDFWIDAESARWQGDSWVFFNMRQVKLQPGGSGADQLIFQAEKASVPDFKITPDTLELPKKKPEELTIDQLAGLIHTLLSAKQYLPSDKEILDYQTQMYFKYTLPLTPLFLIFIALPLAVLPQRSTRSAGFGLALLTVLAYYIMYAMFTKLGAAGVVPPLAAACTPNAVLLVAGVVLMQRREHG